MSLIKKILFLACLLLLAACSQEVLLRDLSERDANEIVAVLNSSSIESKKVADAKGKAFSVVVRSNELPRAISVLKALGLPKAPRPSLNDVFRSTGFAPTPFEEKVRYLYGLAQELERTISLMEGILNTRVHVVIADQESKNLDMRQAKASVFVSYDDRYDIDQFIPKIRKLVSDSIEGLTPDRIEILTIPTRVDLRQITEVPITSFMGVRIHKDDFWLYLIEWAALLGVLGLCFGLLGVDFVRKYKLDTMRAAASSKADKVRS
jgi:type III secretion protein J